MHIRCFADIDKALSVKIKGGSRLCQSLKFWPTVCRVGHLWSFSWQCMRENCDDWMRKTNAVIEAEKKGKSQISVILIWSVTSDRWFHELIATQSIKSFIVDFFFLDDMPTWDLVEHSPIGVALESASSQCLWLAGRVVCSGAVLAQPFKWIRVSLISTQQTRDSMSS